MVRPRGDYSRVEEYLHEIEDDIEFEFGEPFEDLHREDQAQAILDHFFKGIPQYWGSAQDLRDGISYAKTHKGILNIKVTRMTRRGRHYRVVRDAETGRIRQWVKD